MQLDQGKNLLFYSIVTELDFHPCVWKEYVWWITRGWSLGLLVEEAHESRRCHVYQYIRSTAQCLTFMKDQYIFIQINKQNYPQLWQENWFHALCLLSQASLPCLCILGKNKTKQKWEKNQSNNNKMFCPSNAFASTANAEVPWWRPKFLSHGLYLQCSILKISLGFFSPFVSLLLVVIVGQSGGKW